MLSLRAVAKSFAGPAPRRIFSNLSLDVAAGEYVAIVGASGVGKSTLLNVIAGLERADAGTVTVAGVDYDAQDDDALTALRRTTMGFVFQAFHVLPYLDVADNVALPLALQGRHGAAERTRVADMLGAVALADRAHSRPRDVPRPTLVLADEPTGNLDPDSAGQVLALLRNAVKRDGAACVLATHSRTAAASADVVYRLTANGLAPVADGAVD